MDIFNTKKVAGLEFDIQYHLARIKALETLMKEQGIVPPPQPPQGRLYMDYGPFSSVRLR